MDTELPRGLATALSATDGLFSEFDSALTTQRTQKQQCALLEAKTET